ncbi:hypothetical protein Golob_009126 [Gossypium lobatum]|uniref:Uncharacterized protein n=1 Tax=Gossypium lobatum TaxID=34289 RepID=A0A7J8MHG7_9ROSI|nr:hypothetical protein [Gossypium lobatum]
MEVWPQSRVFDLFSQMVQGLYSVYLELAQLVQRFESTSSNLNQMLLNMTWTPKWH